MGNVTEVPSTSIFNVSLCYLQQNFLKSFGSHGSQVTVRGQPLMIISDGFYLQKGLFFLGKGLRNFFFSEGSLQNYFSLGIASQNLFFPGECLSKFIFSLRVPLKIYFSLEGASQNVFFPGEGPPKFFFLDFLQPHPQIITGRPLRVIIIIFGPLPLLQ